MLGNQPCHSEIWSQLMSYSTKICEILSLPSKPKELKKYIHVLYDAHANHRLNGSSSPVLTATPRSYGRGQNSTPYKIKTPERIGMKFGTVDYVLDINPQNKFGDDRRSGGFWVNM